MQYPLPRWFAHRGGGSLAPENTLAGIRLAARLGCRAVEFDVMASADGVPVLIHDETLERTTNGRGSVCDTPYAELARLDAGDGESVPSFAEAARLCRELGLLANIEIKPAAGHDVATAEAAMRVALDVWQGCGQLPLVSSFSLAALAVARDLAPGLPRGLLFEAVPAGWRDEFSRLAAFSLHCDASRLTDAVLHEAAEAAIPVLCYTVNRPDQAARLLQRGVSAMFTDRLDLFAGETTAYKDLHLGG